MGDHRALIKIEFEFHGKTEEVEMWINWSPDSDGIDARIREWFREKAEAGYARYEAMLKKRHKEEKAARPASNINEEEEDERAELARLKAKYDQ